MGMCSRPPPQANFYMTEKLNKWREAMNIYTSQCGNIFCWWSIITTFACPSIYDSTEILEDTIHFLNPTIPSVISRVENKRLRPSSSSIEMKRTPWWSEHLKMDENFHPNGNSKSFNKCTKIELLADCFKTCWEESNSRFRKKVIFFSFTSLKAFTWYFMFVDISYIKRLMS